MANSFILGERNQHCAGLDVYRALRSLEEQRDSLPSKLLGMSELLVRVEEAE